MVPFKALDQPLIIKIVLLFEQMLDFVVESTDVSVYELKNNP